MVEILNDVLGISQISVKDNFFELGGDSIKALQVSSRLQNYGLEIELRDLFRHPVIEDMCRGYVKKKKKESYQGEISGNVALTPVQKAFFGTHYTCEHHYNQSVMLFREEGFEEEILAKVMDSLVKHHDALRMVFKRNESGVFQVNRKVGEGLLYTFDIYDFTVEPNEEAEIEKKAEKIQSGINLEDGPLVKMGLFKTKRGDHLLIVIHHLVVDGVSWRILLEDLTLGYKEAAAGNDISFALKTDSYREWAKALVEYSTSSKAKNELKYWKEIVHKGRSRLPRDKEIAERLYGKTMEKQISLGEKETELLLTKAHIAYHTEVNDLLLAGLGLALGRWTGLENVLISLEGHGREDIGKGMNISRTIGWFTSEFPVLIETCGEIGRVIKQTKEGLRKIPNKGIGYGILKYLEETLLKEQEAEISFNYLGQFDEASEGEDIGISKLGTGKAVADRNENPYAMDISGMVVDGMLTITVLADSEEFREERVLDFLSMYKDALEGIIEHCLAKSESEKTPSDLGVNELTLEDLDMLREVYGTGIERVYTLSNMQAGMLFHALMEEESDSYFEQVGLVIKGKFNIEDFQRCINIISQKYDVLRTNFILEGLSEPHQVVMKERKYRVDYQDARGKSVNEQQAYIRKYKEEDRRKGFDLKKGGIMRFGLIHTGEEEYTLVWSSHHILMDGWCTGIILHDLMSLYGKEKPYSEEEKVTPYEEYIEWLRKQDQEEAKAYWKKYLEGYDRKTGLPKTGMAKKGEYERKTLDFAISREMMEQVTKMSARYSITLNTVFQGIWGLILQSYNNTEDAVFGAVVSGRPGDIAGIEAMVGLFINTVPVRINAAGNPRLIDLMKQVQDEAMEREKYGYLPLVEIQSELELVDHVIAFENFPLKDAASGATEVDHGFSIEGIQTFEQTNYDLDVVVCSQEAMEIRFNYNGKAYEQARMQDLAEQIRHVFSKFVENPEVRIGELEVITLEEKKRILEEFCGTRREYPREKTIHELFEEVVQEKPDNIALLFEGREMSYGELNHKANCLAKLLRDKGIKPGSFVGIMTDRSIEMMVGILGILKSGAAYVPIDPSYPKERITFMLEDGDVKILLVQGSLGKRIETTQQIIDLDDASLYTGSGRDLMNMNQAEDLAYVIYTSGSTGKPKGVMIEHRNVVRLVKNTNYLPFDQDDRILQTGAIVFDASTLEFWGSLLNGLRLYIVSEDTILSAEKLGRALKENRITTLWLTSPLFNQLAEEAPSIFETLRYLLVGGDVLSPSHINRVRRECKGLRIINGYGPTENTTFSLTFNIERDYENQIPIGYPIANSTVYVVGKNNELKPIGAWGELVVGGDGVGRGYLKRPELTAEKFVDNPFEPGARMYHTGDMARWLSDGSVEFGGRIDQQVKIRGFRIELGEIENRILMVDGVKETIVTVREDNRGVKYLCSYYSSDTEVTPGEIREKIQNELPAYMIPSFFVKMDKLPLNVNGKVDRKALPVPEEEPSGIVEYEPPRDEVEEKLVLIWQDILGIERIGIRDNFFELGGHSLKATIAVSRIMKELGKEVPLREIFARPRIKEMGEYIRNTHDTEFNRIDEAEKRDFYPVSSAQKRMYVLSMLEGNGTGYNISGIMEIVGEIDGDRFRETIGKLIERHEAFRTGFELINDEPVQKIYDSIEPDVVVEELNEDEIEKAVEEFVRPFDLSKPPLLRVKLASISNKQHLLMFDVHHIISDGTSMEIVSEEFANLYNGNELPDLRIHYKDFALWQNKISKTEYWKKQEKFWLSRFEGELPILNLAGDYTRPKIQSFEGAVVQITADEDLTRGIERLARESKSTVYMILLAVYNVLLAKYSGQEDIIVGTPTAGRPHADLEGVIGMFVNTLAMRNYPEGHKRFSEFLNEVKENSIGAFENQDYQFEDLVESLEVRRDTSRSPLFDTMFALQNIPVQEKSIEGMEMRPYTREERTAKFDLFVEAFQIGQEIRMNFEYCTKIFKKETIERMGVHFLNLLKVLTELPNTVIGEVEYLSAAEKSILLEEWNHTKMEYPREKMIHELFEEAAERYPGNIALIFEEGQYSYRELNEKADQLAAYLYENGVKPGNVVGILTERSPVMIIGILGILKAGAAYLPLDIDYPDERIEYILKDSSAVALLTQTSFMERISFVNKLDIDLMDIYQRIVPKVMKIRIEPGSLAYIIYTSGSTGKPKGVMIRHSSVVNIITALHSYYPLKEEDTYLLKTTYTFDVSVAELFGWFMEGGRLAILPPMEEKNPRGIIRAIRDYRVTHINFVPSMLKMLMDTLEDEEIESMNRLKYVFTAGEALSVNLWERFVKKINQPVFENIYGPTEMTIYASKFTLKSPEGMVLTPIGKPVANTRAYVLDRGFRLSAIGVPGELCVSGDGIAVGYLNKPELTNEKFVPNPFEPGEKMYRTGDLVRWLPDGNIEYMGRIDYQVKVRGFRIELGEIESRLSGHPDIREAVVIARDDNDGNKYLCAYLIGERELTITQLREYLGKYLPDYMIPSYFIPIDQMPKTPSGKIDRKALPEPDYMIRTGVEYEAPRNEQEEILKEVWQGVLGMENISIHDNFFALGGDSIKALQISARLQKHGLKMEVRDLFLHTTIGDLSPYLTPLTKIAFQGVVEGPVNITPIQHWFLDKNLVAPHHFNQSLFLFRQEGFEDEVVRKVFDYICSHHDALRLVLRKEEEGWKLYNRGIQEGLYDLRIVDLIHETEPAERIAGIAEEIQSGINLQEGPLIKLGLFKTGQGDHLLITIHHFAIDGVSWRILIEDIQSIYEQINDNLEVTLPLKTDSFQSWAEGLIQYSFTSAMKKEVSYWKSLESAGMTNLPELSGEDIPAKERYRDVSVNLSSENTDLLLKKAGQAYNTEINDLLLTGLVTAYSEWVGDKKLLINLEGHGREEIIPELDISRTVGWFTSEFPVLLDLSEGGDLSHQIKSIKESLRKIPNKGIGYGILKFLAPPEIKEGLLLNLKPEISFNYLGQFDQDLDTRIIDVSDMDGGHEISDLNERFFTIDINCMISDGKLCIMMTYDKSRVSEKSMNSLVELYRVNLDRIIVHCVNKENREFTPHDFGDDNLSLDELSDIEEMFSDS
ncbi:MAG: amino acid adenylation domain-containing protein [Bacteroidales bacterium]|nr:amino acid adenylation domain-containing protein [Bacteroidales bacterium]